MIDAQKYYPFTAVVGQNRLKRFLSACAVSSDIGVVLIKGPIRTMKLRLVSGMCQASYSICDGKTPDFTILKNYEEHEFNDIINENNLKYVVIQSFERYDLSEKDEILKLWITKNNRESMLILLENDSNSDTYKNIDFIVNVKPINDIERRIEMVKRERDHLSDKTAFKKRFEEMENEFINRVRKAKNIRNEVNVAETLRVELEKKLSNVFENMDFKRQYECILRYACAEAAFNNRRWVSRDDIEAGLSYLNEPA